MNFLFIAQLRTWSQKNWWFIVRRIHPGSWSAKPKIYQVECLAGWNRATVLLLREWWHWQPCFHARNILAVVGLWKRGCSRRAHWYANNSERTRTATRISMEKSARSISLRDQKFMRVQQDVWLFALAERVKLTRTKSQCVCVCLKRRCFIFIFI